MYAEYLGLKSIHKTGVVYIVILLNGHKGKRRLRVKAPLDGNITAMAKNNKGSPIARWRTMSEGSVLIGKGVKT
jgi:hypothetical protein